MTRTIAATWAVAVRELKARWIVCPAAVVIGTIAMLAIRQVSFKAGDADTTLFGAWIATFIVGGLIGLSLLGDELTNGRLSFYFTRPFKPETIFGGKLLGGVIAALVIQAAILGLVSLGLPEIAWRGSELSIGGAPLRIAEVFVATCASVALGMAAGIAIRSGTRWFVVDAFGVVIVGVVVAFVGVHISHVTGGARQALHMAGSNASSHHSEHYDLYVRYLTNVSLLQLVALIVLVIGFAFATSRALARGRTDAARTHATLSKTLWPILVPASGVMIAATLLWF